jgi:hypothetical protein
MEQSIWNYFIDTMLAPEIENLLLLIVDNLYYHMLAESINYCAKQLGSEVCSLLGNTTSYCQLLDVGIMGPLKAKIWSM